ncbi:hypothetical protein niasHT_011199 [Heterodera trifolii]|uniref:Peptidase A2 domain-containing protein n=1 Tax=Heterodera trifolii TaxID=157864 RepID=A0ABD2LD51_9BILA
MNALQLGEISVNALNHPSRLVEAPVDVNGKPLDFVFDPGAEITVIDEEAHFQIGRPRLIQCSEIAKYHDGTECTLLPACFCRRPGLLHESQSPFGTKGGCYSRVLQTTSSAIQHTSIVEAELDRLLTQKVIRPIDHTRWAAQIVVVKKANGAARVCADFSTGLNNALL